MKIVIPGGTGHVGRELAQFLHGTGHEVVVLSRSPKVEAWRMVFWDGKSQGDWSAEIDNADAVINLAGYTVNCRYHPRNRKVILDSRIDSTNAVAAAIQDAENPPSVWMNMSTATIYAHRFDAANEEYTGIIGGNEPNLPDTWRFSYDVAKRWEQAAMAAETPHTRKILLRTAMVMNDVDGAVFDVLSGLVRRGLGGRNGSGKQFVSWIHGRDFNRAIAFLLTNEGLQGVVNLAAPNPVRNQMLMRVMRDVHGRRVGLAASEWMLAIGAWVLRTETELILKSRRVVGQRLIDAGFEFEFAEWRDAAADLRRVRKGRSLGELLIASTW